MSTPSKVLWFAFAAFVVCAVHFSKHEILLIGAGPFGAVRLLIWLAFLGFTAYSFYCSFRENLFKTVGLMSKLHWGRQIGLDLYLGLSLSLFVIHLNEGPLAVLLWLLPMLIFANQATLLYFALHFDSIVAKLGGGA